jgi:hypothetical protein
MRADAMRPNGQPPAAARSRPRGQILVIFAMSIVAFIGLCAIVTDVAWYWANSLRMQRAADAAALAGVVHLPGNKLEAIAVARAEARKNGYIHGADGYTVTPVPDPANVRRLHVTISGPVSTYFANVFGIATFQASRQSRAEYVLPVPMGSPESYYGVGFFERRVATITPGPVQNSGFDRTGQAVSGQWQSPGEATNDSGSNQTSSMAVESTSGESHVWRSFGLLSGGDGVPNDPTLEIRGIEVRLNDARIQGSGGSSDCQVQAQLVVLGGSPSPWDSATRTVAIPAGNGFNDYVLGDNTDVTVWGTKPTPWRRADLDDSNLRVRLTWSEGAGCDASRLVQIDAIEVRVFYRTSTTTWTDEPLPVPDPGGAGSLASQGFWGAIFTPGGIRTNGDRYGPADIGYNAVGNPPDDAENPDFEGLGYDYTIEVGASGAVRLFDPLFCATGPNPGGGSYGAGDHWTEHASGDSSRTVLGPVAVTYALFDAGTNLQSTSDDTPVGSVLRYDPGANLLGDFSGAFGVPQNQADGIGGLDRDCSADPAHNQWVLPTGWSALPAGFYRLNVNTSVDQNGATDGDNFRIGAENMFSIWVGSSGGGARVYGGGRMAAYTNLDAGNQAFFFAQVEGIHAGKTMVITLFDPGESDGNAFLRILSPEGDVYHRATFDWTSNDGRSGDDVTQIQTSDGTPLFDNKVLTIRVPLRASYAVGDLDPMGIGEQGWWRIEYETSSADDTTTWQVELIGNPVHLVVP